jgi:DNA-binding NarL/FixJ family response regulator
VRIVIAEDAVILRDGLVQLLTDRGLTVAAAVGDVDALHAAVAEHEPDVVVLDIRMPPTFTNEGLRAAVALREQRPGLGVLLFSQYVEVRYVSDLLTGNAAGVGYLLKERVIAVDDFVDALRRVAAGGTALDPEVVSRLMAGRRSRFGLESLTPREKEVLDLMAQGHTNLGIAHAMVISDRAVEKHVSSIFTKLDLPRTDGQHRRVLAVLRHLGVG